MTENDSFNAPDREDQLKLAEHFYSIQGEGVTVGTPSVFLRLSFCTFDCKWCDTKEVWSGGQWKTFDEIDALFRAHWYYTSIRRGAHLVVTGGDPLLQQAKLVGLFERMADFGENMFNAMVEVETQGAVLPSPAFAKYVRQWNVSPKLANSGMPFEKRIKENVLRWHANTVSCFKFPVETREDLDEVDSIVQKVGIRRSRVLLMPVCSDKESFERVSLEVIKLCRMSGFRYSPRLQLALYNKATGV